MRLIDADKLDMSVKVDGDRTLSPISQLIAQTIIENAQTIESDEDCISRQAAIDAFERFIHELGIKDEPYNYGEMALSVRNVPPVTPKPKTDVLDKIRAEINSPNRGTCDYFIVDRIEEIIDKYTAEKE